MAIIIAIKTMANTYSEVTLHVVFAVKGRKSLIQNAFRDDLYAYIGATLKNHDAYPLAVGGWVDHIHLLFSMPLTRSISQQVGAIKAISSKYVNDRRLLHERFEWQSGYAVFSCSTAHRSNLINYIKNQEEHHKKVTFRNEYLSIMEEYKINYNERYLFEFYDLSKDEF